MNVLFISAWYPNRNDAMSGLFVRKHASAAALFCNVQVLHVQFDANITKSEIVENRFDNIIETYVYLPLIENRYLKIVKLYLGYFAGFKHIKSKGFKPDIVNANILTRTVFFAFLLKILYGIPYIIIEHWSRFLSPDHAFNNTAHKSITKLVVKNAKAVLTVSKVLENGMKKSGLLHENYIRINNVVDDFFFENNEITANKTKNLLHISCFDENAKNTSGIIRTVIRLAEKRNDFRLIIAGDGKDFKEVYNYANSINSDKNLIQFTGEKSPHEISLLFNESCCLVQFSNFETAGVTIAEALASGKPVISSKVGIAPEYINDACGLLIEPGNEKELGDAINFMLDNYKNYHENMIRKFAVNFFSFKTVGKELFKIYGE